MAVGLFAFSDLSYAVSLSWVIWTLKMSQRRKVALSIFMVMLHLLALGAILVRLLMAVIYPEVSALTDYPSVTNAFASSERCLCIIVGCAPTLRHLASLDYSLPGAAPASLSRRWLKPTPRGDGVACASEYRITMSRTLLAEDAHIDLPSPTKPKWIQSPV